MLNDLNNGLRTLFTGCIFWCFFLYVLVSQAISALLFEDAIPVSQVDLLDVTWSSQSYATDTDERISVELEYRNRSTLELVALGTSFELLDCPSPEAPAWRCRLVHREEASSSVSTLPGMRGRADESFVVYRAPRLNGMLVLRTALISVTGKSV